MNNSHIASGQFLIGNRSASKHDGVSGERQARQEPEPAVKTIKLGTF
jgi:hypothetical protein